MQWSFRVRTSLHTTWENTVILRSKETPGRINLCHDWKWACVIKLLSFKSMYNQPHTENWGERGKWQSSGYMGSGRAGWVQSTRQHKGPGLAWWEEQRGWRKAQKESWVILKGNYTYVKTVYGQLYIMKTRIKSNSISLPSPPLYHMVNFVKILLF